jgi:hypothetical protein
MDHAHGAAGGELGNGIGNRGRIGTASCALMNVVNIERSKSGDADPSCSCRNRVGSILDGAVIAWFSCRTVEGLQEDHAVTALPVYATPLTRACRTPLCWTQLAEFRAPTPVKCTKARYQPPR